MPRPRARSSEPAGPLARVTVMLAFAAGLAACTEPGTGPRAPAGGASDPAFAKTPATSCISKPVQPLLVTPSALVIAAGQSASFTACTQYESVYAISSSNPAVATVPATVTPTQAAPDAPYTASVSVSVPASAPGGATAVITVTDKKGNRRTVAVTVPPGTATLDYSGQVTTYAVPVSGRYTITATGATGGDGYLSSPGGHGATAQGDFVLSAGTMLTVVVGGRGEAWTQPGTNGGSGGGGGGSFVFLAPSAAGTQPTPLVVGGGGGGAGQAAGAGGNTDPTGAAGAGANCCGGISGGGGSGGLGGGGGTYTFNNIGGAGGGGGLFGAGGDGLGRSTGNASGGGTYTSTSPFAGGAPSTSGGGSGGFGGGGGSSGISGGGGGGHSGGGGGGGWVGAGGGSYVNTAPGAGVGFTFVAGSNSLTVAATIGNGAVTITYQGAQ